MCLICFFASLYIATYQKIEDIEARVSPGIFDIEVADRNLTNENFIFIGSNARYIFLRELEGGVEVIPVNQIRHISLETR